MDNIKVGLRSICECGIDLHGLGKGAVMASYEYGNGTSGPIKTAGNLDQLSHHQLLKKGFKL